MHHRCSYNLFQDISTPVFRTLTQSLFRIGVPFYFIVSGYYFASKLENMERSAQWLKRLLKIYLVFEILDIVLTALVPRIAWPVSYVILRFFTTGLNRIYWYLVSLILTCFLCRGLWHKGYTFDLICAGLFLYLITMTYDSYSFLFGNTFMAGSGKPTRPSGPGRRQASANPFSFFPWGCISGRKSRKSGI